MSSFYLFLKVYIFKSKIKQKFKFCFSFIFVLLFALYSLSLFQDSFNFEKKECEKLAENFSTCQRISKNIFLKKTKSFFLFCFIKFSTENHPNKINFIYRFSIWDVLEKNMTNIKYGSLAKHNRIFTNNIFDFVNFIFAQSIYFSKVLSFF